MTVDPNQQDKAELKLFKNKKTQISIMVGVLIIALIVTISFRFEDFQGYATENIPLTLAASLLIYILLGLTFIPSSAITLFLALLIGPFQAALFATLGNTLSALVGYKVGQTLGDILNFEEKKKNLPFNLGKLPIDSPYILLFGRLIPGGVRGLSYVAGAYQVPMKLYLPTTLTMALLSAFFIAFGGETLISLI
ncbi:MAG TPA: hypothetical protein DCL08_00970 [Anaerolineaceae bacterium]|nr:hypothetical protein [Anaerolineaceae bacterium]